MISASFNSDPVLFFSGSLPTLEISSDLEAVRVSVKSVDPDRVIFSTRIFILSFLPLDIKSIIIADMRNRNVAAQKYSIAIEDPDGVEESVILSLTVIASRGKFDIPAEQFTADHFLSLSDSKIMPAVNAFDSVSCWTQEDEFGSLELTYSLSGVSKTYSVPMAATAGMTRFDIDFQQIISQREAGAVPVSAILSVGDRIMKYYFSSMHPSAAVSYLNNFLCPEHFWMFGKWKRSGKVSQSTAICNTQNVAGSIEVKPEFELITQPLDFRQTYIIPEIAMSRVVWVYLFAEGSPLAKAAFKAQPVTGNKWPALAASTFKAVPTEGALDVSPNDSDPAEYSLKVIAAETEAALGFNYEIPRIFTHQFQRPFI